jgi:polyhydroxyalkanoate synthesis regulator phasin
MVVTEVRRYMEAAVEKLTPAKAQQMARSLLEGQSKGKEQVQRVAQDLMDWSNQTRDRMTEMVRREVARQLKTMGVASRDEVDALKARVRDLERAARSSAKAAASKAVPPKTTASKTTASKAAAAKPGAPKATAPGAEATVRRRRGPGSDVGGS